MRPIGFSTGAVAYADFRSALEILAQTNTDAIELSALRADELHPLVDAIGALPLARYRHVSVHLPSHFAPDLENEFCDLIAGLPEEWPLVIHPDVIRNFEQWRALGSRVCVENMDKRKPIGQTRNDLLRIFEVLPEASFCFDIGHAHQIDPTMCEAIMILREFRGRLREFHISEVNSESKHDLISLEAQRSFEIVARLIPDEIPAIIESRVAASGEFLGDEVRCRIEHEALLVRKLLRVPVQIAAD
jgi:sugar phosphate isomerase/epimerase